MPENSGCLKSQSDFYNSDLYVDHYTQEEEEKERIFEYLKRQNNLFQNDEILLQKAKKISKLLGGQKK
jgi:hypothetical protein